VDVLRQPVRAEKGRGDGEYRHATANWFRGVAQCRDAGRATRRDRSSVSGADDLSGGWDGIYNYPRAMRPNAFTATLRDSAGLLAGETSEPSQEREDRGVILHALIAGSREGSTVRFVKTYDAPSRAHYAVFYSGTVNGEGTEINGRWDIPGVWSGTFIMVRQVGDEAAAEAKIAETVR
jgi:hypothetical protein